MTALVLALLGPAPLPTEQPAIDSFAVSVRVGPVGSGLGWSLEVARDGTVKYAYASRVNGDALKANNTFSLNKDEVEALCRELVAAGLLDLRPGQGNAPGSVSVGVFRGRWGAQLVGDELPRKVLERLHPLLARAHKEEWGKRAAPAAPEQKALSAFNCSIRTTTGDEIALAVSRTGTVKYSRVNWDGTREKVFAREEWEVPAKDAAAVLDALVKGGALDLPDAAPGTNPSVTLVATAGPWSTKFAPAKFPDELLAHLRPFLKKADADFWK